MGKKKKDQRDGRQRSSCEALLHDLTRAHKRNRRYLEDRWYQLTRSKRVADRARNWDHASRLVSVAGLALLPALVTLEAANPNNRPLQVIAICTSVVVALSGAVLSHAKVHERWQLYHDLQGKLGEAGWGLLNHSMSYCTFVRTVDCILTSAEAVYRSRVAGSAAPDMEPTKGRGSEASGPVAVPA